MSDQEHKEDVDKVTEETAHTPTGCLLYTSRPHLSFMKCSMQS